MTGVMDTLKIRIPRIINKSTSEHPYLISFTLSFFVMVVFLFYTPPDKIVKQDELIDVFQVMDIDKIVMPKRVAKKDIDINAETDVQQTDVERAEGLSEADDAVDLSFYPNVVPPRPIGRLKKIYPESARQREVEATLFVSLVVNKEGKVLIVKILSSRLSKPLPPEVASQLKKEFANAAVKILKSARFSPPIIDGKKVSIVMEMPLKFQLN